MLPADGWVRTMLSRVALYAEDLKDTISQGFDRVGLSEVRGLR